FFPFHSIICPVLLVHPTFRHRRCIQSRCSLLRMFSHFVGQHCLRRPTNSRETRPHQYASLLCGYSLADLYTHNNPRRPSPHPSWLASLRFAVVGPCCCNRDVPRREPWFGSPNL